MSKTLRTLFAVHALVSGILGALMLLIPGRLLTGLGWSPIDPIVSRLLGAALLALSWSSYRGWRASEWRRVAILVEMEAIYTILACVGLLRHLLFARWPFYVWLVFVVYAAFAVAWVVAWVKK